MIKRIQVTFPLPEGSEERTAYIYLPSTYHTNKRKRFPVLYMFDGHNVFFDSDATFGKSWGLGEYLDRTGTQIIIAAVECNHSPDNGRLKEYAPFSFVDSTLGQIEALGKTTMDWFVQVFKKRIDRSFRTLSGRDHTFIAGSSMGGLMSLYALLEYNAVFSRAAALSPSLWVSPQQVKKMLAEAKTTPDTVLYMDYGSEELHNHGEMQQLFGTCAASLIQKGILLNFRIVPGGTHCEASWERQIPYFMHTLLYKYPTEK